MPFLNDQLQQVSYWGCPCTHFVFAVDKSVSMSWFDLWDPAKNALDMFFAILKFFNDLSPTTPPYYFASYYEFDKIAYPPIKLHVKPFLNPSNTLSSPGGSTNFNAAIYRAI